MTEKNKKKQKDVYRESIFDYLEANSEPLIDREKYTDSIFEMLERANGPEDEYSDSIFDLLEKNSSNAGVGYSRDTVSIDFKSFDYCEGLGCIEDFVDIDMLKQAIMKNGMELPARIVFKRFNLLYNKMGIGGTTNTSSQNTICINIDYVHEKNELMIVEAIAHETWHLRKQPKVIRSIPLIRKSYELDSTKFTIKLQGESQVIYQGRRFRG